MWVLQKIGAALIILLILGFALQNQAQQVSVTFIRGVYESGPLPLWLVMYLSFGLGMLFWLFVSIFQVFSLKAEIRKMRMDNQRMKKELDNLRNLSIDDEIEIRELPEETRKEQPKEPRKQPRKAIAEARSPIENE